MTHPNGPSQTAPRRFRLSKGGATVLGWALIALGAVFTSASAWVRRTFGQISVDQLVLNVQGGGEQGGGGTEIVADGVMWGLVAPLLAVLAIAVCVARARRSLRARRPARSHRFTAWTRVVAVACVIAVPLAGAVSLSSTIGVGAYINSYVREATTGTTLGDFYVVPGLTGAAAAKTTGANLPGLAAAGGQRNLIVIYLESVEDALADDTLFEKNMLAPVQQATAGWATIPHLSQYEGGGWTMAGIVSTQCGVPLRSAGASVNIAELNSLGANGEPVESYLPGAVCLGDVLHDRGYRNVFLGGADADFAGKGTFLSGHGYDEVRDLSTWQDAGETELRPDWGLSDRRLFALAAETVTELHESGQPFNLSVLSLDTHEQAYAHDYCEVDTAAPMTAITLCSMRQVAGFIDYLGAMGYLDDTAVMVMGDHEKFIARSNSFEAELSTLTTRTIFNRMWLPAGAGLKIQRESTDQLSMYATLLELAGVQAPDHRAGVGVSVFAPKAPKGSLPTLAADEYSDVVTSRSSAFYGSLWGGPAGAERVATETSHGQ